MIDLRYHVYSLAAVFFALAIGIVIGSSFVGKPTDREQLRRVSQRYERNLEGMKREVYKQRNDIRAARADFRRSEELCSSLMPLALKSRLLYYNVAIVQTGDYDELASSIKRSLESVGAHVTSVTKIPTAFSFDDTQAVKEALSSARIVRKPGEPAQSAIARVVADAVVLADQADRLPALEDEKAVILTGDYRRWNRHVVIVGGSKLERSDRAERLDIPVIERVQGHGATVVACEPFSARTSCVPIWKRAGIATVDNADRACGQVALICALAGEIANFGQKRSAERQTPETLEEAQQ